MYLVFIETIKRVDSECDRDPVFSSKLGFFPVSMQLYSIGIRTYALL